MDDQRQVIDGFKEAVFNIWLRDGQNTWPIDINAIVHLFMDVFVAELLQDTDRLKAKGYGDRDMAVLFKTSARIIRLIMPCVLGLKAMKMPVDKQREHVLYWLSLLKYLKHGDLFNRDGRNIVLSPPAFIEAVDQAKMMAADRKKSRLLHQLCAILWNYAESVCFKTHGLVREFHGPYCFEGKSEEILIRDFICLKPLSLWPQCRPVPYNRVRVAAGYEGLDMSIDIYNNVSIKEGGRYIDSLRFYYVEADGQILNLDEIDALCKVLSRVMISITGGVEGLHWRQLARKYAEIFWFAKKELRDELQEDWHCPDLVGERIERGSLSTKFQNLTPRELQLMLRIAF